MKKKPKTFCETCGCPVKIEGKTTNYYVPQLGFTMAEIRKAFQIWIRWQETRRIDDPEAVYLENVEAELRRMKTTKSTKQCKK